VRYTLQIESKNLKNYAVLIQNILKTYIYINIKSLHKRPTGE